MLRRGFNSAAQATPPASLQGEGSGLQGSPITWRGLCGSRSARWEIVGKPTC